MDRRRFLLTSLAGAVVGPFVAEAQPAGKTWRIGVLSFTSFPGEENRRIEAFRGGLQHLGYVERQNLSIEYRYSDGNDAPLPTLAAELVRLRVSVIATYGTKATQAAKQATSNRMTRLRANALIVLPGDVTTTHRASILGLAIKNRLPTL